jgi:hypothetical protein
VFTRCCSSPSAVVSFCSSSVSCWCCGLAGQRLAGQVLPALRQRGLGLVLQVIHRMLELGFLQLDLLAGSRDVDESPADPGDLLEHLVIRQVEHLVRLLGGIECLVRLGGNYVVGPLKEAHPGLLSIDRSIAFACAAGISLRKPGSR